MGFLEFVLIWSGQVQCNTCVCNMGVLRVLQRHSSITEWSDTGPYWNSMWASLVVRDRGTSDRYCESCFIRILHSWEWGIAIHIQDCQYVWLFLPYRLPHSRLASFSWCLASNPTVHKGEGVTAPMTALPFLPPSATAQVPLSRSKISPRC